MKTRKIISFITAFVLALTLTACGSGSGSSDAPEADNTVSRSEDGLWNKTFEGVTLKRILWYEPSKSEEELKKKFEKKSHTLMLITVGFTTLTVEKPQGFDKGLMEMLRGGRNWK